MISFLLFWPLHRFFSVHGRNHAFFLPPQPVQRHSWCEPLPSARGDFSPHEAACCVGCRAGRRFWRASVVSMLGRVGAVHESKSPVPFPSMPVPPFAIFMQLLLLHRQDKNNYYSYSSNSSNERFYKNAVYNYSTSSLKHRVAGACALHLRALSYSHCRILFLLVSLMQFLFCSFPPVWIAIFWLIKRCVWC